MHRTSLFKFTLKTLIALAILVVTTGSHRPVQAGCGLHEALCPSSHACCPHCQYKCKFEAKKVDEERTCWEIEHDVICVPRVVFPWQKNRCNPCPNNGAVIKCVKTLKKHTYKCPKCEYTWTPEKMEACGACRSCTPCSCGNSDCCGCGNSGCGSCGCSKGGCGKGGCSGCDSGSCGRGCCDAIPADATPCAMESVPSGVVQTSAESDDAGELVSVPVEEAKPAISRWLRLPNIR